MRSKFAMIGGSSDTLKSSLLVLFGPYKKRLLFSFIHKARKRFKHSCLSSLIPLAHSTPSQATPSGLIFCYLSVLSFQTRPLISTRALLVTRIGLLSTHRRRR